MAPFLPLLFALLLAGCAGRPAFQPPVPWTPAAWRGAAPGVTADPVAPEWWLGFHDPVLTGLMARAIGNAGVRAATARIPLNRAPDPVEREARRAALVRARSEAAQAYMRLRGAQARLRLLRDAGTDPAGLTGPELAEAQGINAVARVLGAPPGALDAALRPAAPIPSAPVRIAAGLPSELARRHPDVRLAELALQAAAAEDAGPAAAAYQTAVLQAFMDVDDAMLAYVAGQRRREVEAGPVRRTTLAMRLQRVDGDVALAASAAALYGALGTGWEPPAGPLPERAAVTPAGG